MVNSEFRNKNENYLSKENLNRKSVFRNNLKYSFHDSGCCNLGEKCRKQHFKTFCSDPDCDKTCKSRHPRICKFKAKCKFFAKEICAYMHVTLACDDRELNALKIQVESLQQVNEAKLYKLTKIKKRNLKFSI